MKRKISEITIGKRYRKDKGNLTPLAASIASVGLLHPVVITQDGVLVAGERRLLACKQIGWEEIPVTICNLESILQAEHDENDDEIRKAFTVSERTAIAKAIEGSLKQGGERRGRPAKTTKNHKPSEIIHEGQNTLTNSEIAEKMTETENVAARPHFPEGQKSREAVAKAAGFESEQQLRYAKLLEEQGSQDLRDAVDDGVISLFDAQAICNDEHDLQTEAVKRVLYGSFKTVRSAMAAIRQERDDRSIELQPVVDCNGVNVPDTLREYYEAAAIFDEVLAIMKSGRFKLNELDKHPISNYRNRGQLQSYLKTIEAAMENERFGMVCPACEGAQEGNCNCCDNVRWFNVLEMDKVDLRKWKRTA